MTTEPTPKWSVICNKAKNRDGSGIIDRVERIVLADNRAEAEAIFRENWQCFASIEVTQIGEF